MKLEFVKPGDVYKPGVYWYFMDGNMTAETMTKDLESMKKAGIGNLIFLEVNVGIPRGKVDFLSEEWTTLFAHAEKEARRLGIEITLGIGPGWTGSGGPWVKGNQSMQHLVSTELIVSSTEKKKITLPLPLPKKPFFGEDGFTSEFKKNWLNYYEDVAVLAFPLTKGNEKIQDIDEQALYQRAPFSSGIVKANLPAPGNLRGDSGSAIKKNKIIDLTGKMLPDGTLNWSPPSGKWKIMRFGSRNNGAITRPAPFPGIGFESDKFDTTALHAHLDAYLGKIFNKIDKIQKNQSGGLKRLHLDSWEMGAQNWTSVFRKEFTRRRGYDPLKYYPVYSGNIVGSLKESERFLWDLRQTAQELVLEKHAGYIKAYAKGHNLTLSIEPYDMNPTSDLELGNIADVPMAEFWSKGYGFNSTYSVIEATSIAHVMGRSLVPAEAFTAENEKWKQYPGSMKNQGDWAFASGINRFVYHTFQNQFLPDSLKPGATMGPYGVHWDRSQTWWPMVDRYHDYITRCQYLLQQGRTVADILYLIPEGSPHVFIPPSSAILGDTIGDRKRYNFDGVAPGQLMKATVKNNKILFPGGASYEIMVLPIYETMTPQLLEKIGNLIEQGATVVGNPPLRSPSLTNYPECDVQLKTLSNKIWGKSPLPVILTHRKYGLGTIIWGKPITLTKDKLYPGYELTSDILKSKGISEDFTSDAKIRYTHRTSADWDIYFISNTSSNAVIANNHFRSVKGSPELWNAINGESNQITQFKTANDITSIPIKLDAYESAFIIFGKGNRWKADQNENLPKEQTVQTLNEHWTINFDEKWGGPKEVVFDSLSDWSKSNVGGIKYYSGIARYHHTFEFTGEKQNQLFLDLGDVKNMARVHLNGKEIGVLWTAPWRLNISDFLKKGKNEIEIEVVNLWSNRLIGDEKKPYDGVVGDQWPEWLLTGQPRTSGRYTFTTTRQYKADSPLLPSGLIGPVKIIQYK